MPAQKILENIYWVGAIDWNIRYFHGPAYSTHRGTTYNAYLIIDEKITLVDTVYGPFSQELVANISEIIDPSGIDQVIINHVETDHSGAFPEIIRLAPNAQVFCTQKGKEGLLSHYFLDNVDYRVVKTGDRISLGKKSVEFIEAPMLHWPDSMFSYIPEDRLLMPNDAFGQHIATSLLYDDMLDPGILMLEAAKYYANILMPFSSFVIKKLDEISGMGIAVDIIAPSHGVIWRTDPGRIIDTYRRWASAETLDKAVIIYDTMWNSTEKIANALAKGLMSQGIETKVYKNFVSDRNDMLTDLMDAKALLVGSPTINNGMLPTLAPFLDDLKGLRFKGKKAMAFGSYGWGGGATKEIEKSLSAAGFEILDKAPTLKYVPTPDDLDRLYNIGKDMALKLKTEPV
jgi:anaerobic nitric oxide reductase flavorubredoxin